MRKKEGGSVFGNGHERTLPYLMRAVNLLGKTLTNLLRDGENKSTAISTLGPRRLVVSKSLNEWREKLEQLERIVMDEYYRLEAEAAVGGVDYIRIPEPIAHGFLRHMTDMWHKLFGSADRDLALVSDEHDELRLRLMVLERLVERDIPFAYLDRALSRFLDLRPRVAAVASPRSPPVEEVLVLRRGHFASEWIATAKALLVGALDRLRARLLPTQPTPLEAPSIPLVAQIQPDAAPYTPPAIPEHLLRLILLYKLMQEDAQGLMAPEQRLAPLDTRWTLHGEAARFYARDLHEQFWNVRPVAGDVQARTPEELRRKLQARSHSYDQSRNAA